MAKIRKPDVVVVELTRDEVRVIVRGLRALRTYEVGDQDTALDLISDLDEDE